MWVIWDCVLIVYIHVSKLGTGYVFRSLFSLHHAAPDLVDPPPDLGYAMIIISRFVNLKISLIFSLLTVEMIIIASNR